MLVERTWEQRSEAREVAAAELQRFGLAARMVEPDLARVAEFMVDTGTPVGVVERLIFALGVAALIKVKPPVRTLIAVLNSQPARLTEGEDDLPF